MTGHIQVPHTICHTEMVKSNYAICDLQSAGMVCFYIMSRGTHPYEVDGEYDLVHHNVRQGQYNLSKVEDPVACDLVEKMLAHEPKDRLPAGELLR